MHCQLIINSSYHSSFNANLTQTNVLEVLPFKNAPTQGPSPGRKVATLVEWQFRMIGKEKDHIPLTNFSREYFNLRDKVRDKFRKLRTDERHSLQLR
jgi:hypothetical protein